MKKISQIIFVIAITTSAQVLGCPTCVGRIRPESPPFFSAEFYQQGQPVSRETKEQFGQNRFKKLMLDKKDKQ